MGRPARVDHRVSPGIAGAGGASITERQPAPSPIEYGRTQGISIFLQKTILQLFSSTNGSNEWAEKSRDGAPGARSASNKPQAPSGSNGSSADERSTDAFAATISSRFPLWKRILDLTLVLLTMCIWLPLMMLISCLIKITSPGPAFYRQRRIGFRGRPFMIFKFRSMKVNAETRTHEDYVERLMRSESPLTKLDADDPRLISFGRFLRATGFDELPQLFNVLRGEMSLVGPRPCTDREFESYLPWQKARVAAPPGLTGYWQVNGKNKTTFSQMMQMDLYYAREMSLWLDLKIICKTIPAIVEQSLDSFARRSLNEGASKLIAVGTRRNFSGSAR